MVMREEERKWQSEYIDYVDISDIEWIKLNPEELQTFFDENYFDKELYKWVATYGNSFITPFGLHYLNFDPLGGMTTLLGVVDNNIGKKTIVAAVVYNENYYFLQDQGAPLTYLSTIETNSFFWYQGTFKQTCDVWSKIINPKQHVMISRESETGKVVGVAKAIENALRRNGFRENIIVDENLNYGSEEFAKLVRKRN